MYNWISILFIGRLIDLISLCKTSDMAPVDIVVANGRVGVIN